MKKTILIFALAVIAVCGTACSNNGGSSDSRSQNSVEGSVSSVDSTPESKSDPESPAGTSKTEYERFLSKLDGYDCAVAYIGYANSDDVNSVLEYAKKSPAAGKNPFIADITEDRIIRAGGGEIYCVIPANTDAKVTVNSLSYDKDGKAIIADKLYSAGGAPILLCCNVSDIMPNAAVSITNGDKTLRFDPFLSPRDGRLTLPDDLKILDLSEYGF